MAAAHTDSEGRSGSTPPGHPCVNPTGSDGSSLAVAGMSAQLMAGAAHTAAGDGAPMAVQQQP